MRTHSKESIKWVFEEIKGIDSEKKHFWRCCGCKPTFRSKLTFHFFQLSHWRIFDSRHSTGFRFRFSEEASWSWHRISDQVTPRLEEEEEEREEKPQPTDHWPPHHQLAPPQVFLQIYFEFRNLLRCWGPMDPLSPARSTLGLCCQILYLWNPCEIRISLIFRSKQKRLSKCEHT